jgi:hypothetical protein
MKTRLLRVKIFALSLILLLGLVLAIGVYAQGPYGGEIGATGLADPSLSGYKVLYMFTGVHNKTAAPKFATVTYCTNVGPEQIEVVVQYFDTTGQGQAATAGGLIASNGTKTFSTQAIASFANVVNAYASDIDHGSGRVLVTDTSTVKVVCAAQTLALGSGDVPTDVSTLDMFTP